MWLIRVASWDVYILWNCLRSREKQASLWMPDQLFSFLATRPGLPSENQGKGREGAKDKRPFLTLAASAEVSLWGLNGGVQLCQHDTKTTSDKKRKEKRRNQWLCLHEATLQLFLYRWLVILQSYRQQVWHLGIKSWWMASCTMSLSIFCCCYLKKCTRNGRKDFESRCLAAKIGKKKKKTTQTIDIQLGLLLLVSISKTRLSRSITSHCS